MAMTSDLWVHAIAIKAALFYWILDRPRFLGSEPLFLEPTDLPGPDNQGLFQLFFSQLRG